MPPSRAPLQHEETPVGIHMLSAVADDGHYPLDGAGRPRHRRGLTRRVHRTPAAQRRSARVPRRRRPQHPYGTQGARVRRRLKGAAEVVLPAAGLFHRNPPHSDPEQQVWGNVKAHVAKQTVANQPDLKDQALRALKRLRAVLRPVAGFFRHSHCYSILDAHTAA